MDAYYLETLLLVSGRTPLMYSRTQNENGTYNTRCLECMMTVATAVESEVDLEQVELHHMCPERALAQLLTKEASIVAQERRS